MYTKPLPTPSSVSQPFWDAAKEHRLIFQRCRLCGTRVFYPRDICPGPQCFGVGSLDWVESTGKGRLYSYTVSYQPAHQAFAGDVPYVLAIIEMDEGWRMTSNLINFGSQDALRIGLRVEVVWDDVTPEFSLPKFQPFRQ
ncbi:MAG: hypothetical protein GEU73_10780 [Chloroflexi bacterium]|nr:hypothetical protein [Chloroflexota bacterium]